MAAAVPRPDRSQIAAESTTGARPPAAAEHTNTDATQAEPAAERRAAAPHKWLIAAKQRIFSTGALHLRYGNLALRAGSTVRKK